MPLAFATLLTAASLAAGLGPPPPLALPARQSAGTWSWPLAGTPVVARPFVPPATPWGPGHRGVDLAAPPGATVLAAGPGVVSFAGYVAGVGVVTMVHTGGLRTTYEPVAPLVAVGAVLSLGEPIGTLESGHGDCGPARWCLHWGLLRRSVYLDPLTLIHRGPVRLLPLSGGSAITAVPRNDPPAPLPAPGSGGASRSRPRAAAAGPAPSAAGRPGLIVGGAAAATGTAAAAALAGLIRSARQRRMAARRGRHRGVGVGRSRALPAAGLSRAGRRAWP